MRKAEIADVFKITQNQTNTYSIMETITLSTILPSILLLILTYLIGDVFYSPSNGKNKTQANLIDCKRCGAPDQPAPKCTYCQSKL